MKRFIRFLALILSILTLVSTTACNNKKNDGYVNTTPAEKVEGTVHGGTITQTEKKILSDGKSDYILVIPVDTQGDIEKAAKEFNLFFSEATGIKLPVVSDEGLAYNENAKYISLGNTNVLESSHISIDIVGIKHHGYEIITKDNSIFVCGQARGVLYGVYDLLEHLVGYKNYTTTYYKLDKNLTEIKLPNFQIKEVPDIDYRIAPNGSYQRNITTMTRMRMSNTNDVFIEGCAVHSALSILNPDVYQAEHPDWYMIKNQQLCYTAHGNEEEYAAMVAEAVERCKYYIDRDQEHKFLAFSQIDISTWCQCANCKAVVEKYGGFHTATQNLFINDVAERIEEWLKTDDAGRNKGREVMFVIFAYHYTTNAPALKNSKGEWELVSPDVKLRPNVGVWIAPINGNYVDNLYSSACQPLREIFDGWTVCADYLLVWGYDCYFSKYLVPYDSWNQMQDLTKYLYNRNIKMYWPQGIYNDLGNTHFDNLKMFVWSELMWNVNVDVSALIDEYFAEVYCVQFVFRHFRTAPLKYR